MRQEKKSSVPDADRDLSEATVQVSFYMSRVVFFYAAHIASSEVATRLSVESVGTQERGSRASVSVLLATEL